MYMYAYEKTLSDYFGALRRRKWQAIVPALLIMLFAVIFALSLPAIYRSTATILIEQQDIPQDLVRSTVTSFAAERIQMLNQQVMTTSNLLKIIDKYDLYSDERKKQSIDNVLAKMRDAVKLDMISADVIDPRSGRSTQATIAFTLSYQSKIPRLAQQVTNELVSLYLNENLKTRTQQAADTYEFLADEAEKLNQQLTELEAQLATFKQKNLRQLPEMVQLNMQVMQRADQEYAETKRQIALLEERKIYLQSELAQMQPNNRIMTFGGQRVLSSEDQLKMLEMQYLQLAATYAETHPDVMKLKRQIISLTEDAKSSVSHALVNELAKARAGLTQSQSRYAENHPDVKRLQRTVNDLESQLANLSLNTVDSLNGHAKPDNPAYIQLLTQLKATNIELVSITEKADSQKIKMSVYEKRLLKTPHVEKQYRRLTRDYETTLFKYKEIKVKLNQAQLAEELEKGSKAERFTLIEPPRQPDKPDKPNRIAILFLGLIFSFAGGLGVAALAEGLDHSVRGEKSIAAVTGSTPIAVIPYIVTQTEISKRRLYLLIGMIASLVVVSIGLVVIHAYYKPVDVLWFLLLDKLSMTSA